MDLSIVMVTCIHSQKLLDMTNKCIDSFLKDLRCDFELIIVDNDSEPVFQKQILRSVMNLKNGVCVVSKKNQGWVMVNKGIEQAKGEYLFLANNDLFACRDWFPRLRGHISSGVCAFAGPLSNAIMGDQKLNLYYENTESFYTATDALFLKNKNRCKLTHHLGGGCLLCKKEAFLKVGYLEDFGLGGCEDTDHCVRCKLLGYKLGVAQDTFFHHDFNATYKHLGIDYVEENFKSVNLLIEKYGEKTGHFLNSIDLL